MGGRPATPPGPLRRQTPLNTSRRRENFRGISLPRNKRRVGFRRSGVEKPSFLAFASPPSLDLTNSVFEFLVKSIGKSTAELLCGLDKGDFGELISVMEKGFNSDQISPHTSVI